MTEVMKIDLSNALLTLLNTKRLDQITIKKLTEVGHCSRMSFYYHFRSMNELVEYTFLRIGNQILAQENKEDSYSRKMKLLMMSAQKYKKVIDNVYYSTGRTQVENFLYRVVSDYIGDIIDMQDLSKKLSPKQKKQIVDFYKYSCVGELLDWVEQGMPDEYQETIDWISSIIVNTLPGACEAVARKGEKNCGKAEKEL